MGNTEYLHGAVFKVTREDTKESIRLNLRQMKESGFNTVVVWPAAFWWEEKKEGYPYNTGRFILKTAEEIGLKIIMELAGQITCMEYMPDFLMKEEYYAKKSDGSIEFGQPSFGFLNYFNPEVTDIITTNFKETAAAYKNFSALAAYDIFNETMFRSFDEYTISEFRTYLKEKYKTVEKLNSVWERTYTDFSQITYQEWKWLSVMPQADWFSFKKASITRFLGKWCAAVRQADSNHPLIADNIFSCATPAGSYDRPQDDFSLQETVDTIGMSFYPKSVSGVLEPALRHEIFSGFFAASKRNGFMLSEMQTHIQALFNPTTAVKKEELLQWCYESIAGGATALIYWMWRPFTKGLQTLGRGLVDHKNRPTERLDAAKEMAEFFKLNRVVKPVQAKIAVVYDSFCEDLQKTYTIAYNVDQNIYINSVYGAYKAFFDAGIPCDITTLDDIENYKTIVLVNHVALSDEYSDKLTKYVKSGGNIIIDGKTGIVDENGLAHKNIPCGKFNAFVGTDFTDSDYENTTFDFCGKKINGYYGKDIVSVADGAEIAAKFCDGTPAIVINNNHGDVISINTQLFYGYFKTSDKSVPSFVNDISERFNLRQYTLGGNLYCKLAENEQNRYAFIFNYSDKEQKCLFETDGFSTEISVKAHGTEVLKWQKTKF